MIIGVNFNDFINKIDTRLLEENKLSKSELKEILNEYINKDEINNIIGYVPYSDNYKKISDELNEKINSLVIDIDNRFNAIPNLSDLNNISINEKINIGDIQNALLQKLIKLILLIL